ncbi:MAG: hypothetical protein KJ732_06555 [Candidatus Margulisbacteria bacterium]|nr:hypothetical protein [Candidatus Margulisiibacteriota bacterium]
MKKILVGLLFGALAGVIDVVPMVMQKLPWDANLSAFTMWVVVGFLVSVVDLKINNILKGIVIAFLCLAPIAVLIAAQEPMTLVPIFIMALILGSGVGFFVGKFGS